MVRDFDPGYDGSVPGDLTSFRGSLAFTIAFPQPGGLWTTNGDPAGTNEVAPTTAWGLAAAGNSLFFVGSDAATGSELWRSDGTPQGTHLVLDILAGPGSPNIFGITPVGGRVFFRVQSPAGEDLWTSDGTPLGTRPLHAFRSMDELTSAGAFLYFTADDGEHGAELWRSDGTPEGTRLVADVAPGPASSSPASLTAVGDRILFAADDGIHGVEPWVSDGAPEGTKLLEDLSPGPASSAPAEFRDSGDVIYFRASREDVGAQLWSLPSSAIGPRPGERPRPTRILPPR
jgi:ELWxxDGT repeat protein